MFKYAIDSEERDHGDVSGVMSQLQVMGFEREQIRSAMELSNSTDTSTLIDTILKQGNSAYVPFL